MWILTTEIPWPAWKISVLKVATTTLGILLGAYFPEFWRPWLPVIWIAFAVSTVLTTVWALPILWRGRHDALSKT
jgi:hypothetical protein